MDARTSMRMTESSWPPDRIRQLRESRGLTQEQFAREVGVTVGALNRWECGKRRPTGLSVRRLEELASLQRSA